MSNIAFSLDPGKEYYDFSLIGIEPLIDKWRGKKIVNNGTLYFVTSDYRMHISGKGQIKVFIEDSETPAKIYFVLNDILNKHRELLGESVQTIIIHWPSAKDFREIKKQIVDKLFPFITIRDNSQQCTMVSSFFN